MNKNTPFVSICCITYNHEAYIRECLDGFIMQKTNFPYEVIIYDDASTDNNAIIISEYEAKLPKLIKVIYQVENQFSKGVRGIAARFTFPHAQGKYIALCEGDDYWTDPYKLQKQVDFMENNPDFGMVHTAVNVVDNMGNLIIASDYDRPSGDVFFDLLNKSAFIVTCSSCFRTIIAKEVTDYASKSKLKCVFDYWVWLHIAMRTKIYYYPQITSAYRSHPKGVTQSVKGLFKKISPLAVLDAVSYKLVHFPEKMFCKKWELYVNYCRALTASSLSRLDRSRYFQFLLRQPIFLFAFFPAIWRKVKLRFYKRR